MPSELTKQFGLSSETPSGHTLEELRQNYFIEAQMKGLDDNNIGGLRINAGGRKNAADIEREKQRSMNNFILLNELSKQFDILTDNMMNKYGDDFAEHFAADLLEPEKLAELMKIEDQAERQKAIAQAILDGIKDGAIDPANAYANPDFAEWLHKFDEVTDAQRQYEISLKESELFVAEPTEVEITSELATENGLDDALSGFNLT